MQQYHKKLEKLNNRKFLRKQFSPSTNTDKYVKSLEISIDNRKFEIELLWRRTQVFWGFIAALFIGVATIYTKSNFLAFLLAELALIYSYIWTLSNRGSKSWQESWEIKASKYYHILYGESKNDFYSRVTDKNSNQSLVKLLRPKEVSLSRLLIALSDVSVIFWIIVLCFIIFSNIMKLGTVETDKIAIHLLLFFVELKLLIISLGYIVYVFISTKAKTKGIDINEYFKEEA